MIRPIQPYGIRGALWYQGESITGGSNLYTPLIETLVASWRKEWGQGEFPFLYVQLASYKQTSDVPAAGGGFTGVRDLQRRMLDKIPCCAMAVTIDIGDHNEVHPHNKQELGRRLALAARAVAYGEAVPFTGPVYDSMEPVAGGVRVRFRNADGGLKTCKAENGSEQPAGFAVAGADRQFRWAEARIDGDSVILTCPEVPAPVSVRYAWAAYPLANLYSGSGLPASPFRTDDW
jgi:sialate O-acetylesterase